MMLQVVGSVCERLLQGGRWGLKRAGRQSGSGLSTRAELASHGIEPFRVFLSKLTPVTSSPLSPTPSSPSSRARSTTCFGGDLLGEGEIAIVGIKDFSVLREVGHATGREKWPHSGVLRVVDRYEYTGCGSIAYCYLSI